MDFAISSGRPAHYHLMANALAQRGASITVYTSTPAGKFKKNWPQVKLRFVPELWAILEKLTGIRLPHGATEWTNVIYDRLASMRLGRHDILAAGSTGCLYTGLAMKRLGGKFVLDRACPYAPFQQALVKAEAEKAGGGFRPDSPWYVERQLREYAAADVILSPSEYSRRTFPAELAGKVVLAPLFGRVKVSPYKQRPARETFRVGIVGGNPLRKGYMYLLEAWKQLALPNAELLVRSTGDFDSYPKLRELMQQNNIRLIGHVPNINDFYEQLDLFILPSVDDGFGMALFEAIANNVPCIATSHCGASELLTAGKDAVIVPPADTQALAAAIEHAYRDREHREAIARHGWETLSAMAPQDGSVPAFYQSGIDEMLSRLGFLQPRSDRAQPHMLLAQS